ncbi:sensor histidine kinase [Desertibacillus haloalkaliphilus]|uniref:sensor histidine kinase n=1 Tax=Desertibacillus haloalkaliphilus TaxID=1328930 RepID=UPI001C27BD40|nr:HAMP domain-containing sensor histidine kinase [Desertibacillus haloalkaliphilus]MBU8908751.1 HAMP domain-containing histidine kinase [Desertibacillus haloalkaliphilus]
MMGNIFKKKWFKKEEKQQKEKIEQQLEKTETSSDHYDAVIGRMAAFFAHEIRNPLTSIMGFTQVLENKPNIKENPDTSHYISIIKEEATRMESLIQELLSLSNSHIHQDNLSLIDVNHSIEKIVTIYQVHAAEKNIEIKADLSDETYIFGNANRFERVVINLIKNSIEAIEEHGAIDIKVTRENKWVTISMIDTGPGIPSDQLEQVFYPFYTTKDEGTGIGLSICKTIIETLRGTLEIQNKPPKGAHVMIKIPESQNSPFNK